MNEERILHNILVMCGGGFMSSKNKQKSWQVQVAKNEERKCWACVRFISGQAISSLSRVRSNSNLF